MSQVCCLLVDDLDENLLSLEALLRGDDLRLLKARSGVEALELLLRHEVALALVDVQMPGMDGFELAEFMRGNERTRHVPIIFVTAGSTDRQRRFRGYEAGAVDFIGKPIEPDILRSKARVFFDLDRQRQQILAQRDELEAYAAALRLADQTKDRMLAIVAHELRNPIASLQAGLRLLLRAEPSDDRPVPDRTGRVRGLMEQQLDHLVRLIDDLLDVSRVSAGKISLQREKLDLLDVLTAAADSAQPVMEAAGHSFTYIPPEHTAAIEADRTRLAQIIANLLGNAAKYTPRGGRITLSAETGEASVRIVVSDDGIGIPPDQQAQIFQMFAQVDDHRTHAQGGLGIGLALVRQLVQLHGGSIEVHSQGAGCGSRFSVTLPRLDVEAVAPTGSVRMRGAAG